LLPLQAISANAESDDRITDVVNFIESVLHNSLGDQ
jgi:hypothetical protein